MNRMCRKSMRVVLGFVMACVLMFAMTIDSFAEVTEGSQVKVIGSGARVRSSADTNSDIVITLDSGKIMTVVSITTDAEGATWYQISYHDDSTGQDISGYIRSDLVDFYADAAPQEEVIDESAVEGEGGAEGEVAEGEEVTEDTSGAVDFSGTTGSILTPMNPGEDVEIPPMPEGFKEASVQLMGQAVKGWANETDNGNFYILYGQDNKHSQPGWFILEHLSDGSNVSIAYDSSFMAGGEGNTASIDKTFSGLTIFLMVTTIIFAVATIVLIVKLLNKSGDDDYDDDDDDDEEDDDDDDDSLDRGKKKGFFSKFSRAFEDDEEDDYDDEDDEDEDYIPARKPAQQRPVMSEQRPMAQGQRPVAQGQRPVAQGQRPVAQGQRPVAQGQRPVSQGQRPVAQGQRPMAQGQRPVAQGQRPVAQGQRPVALGQRPIAQGQRPVSQGQRTVQGQRPTQRRVVPQNRPQRPVADQDEYNGDN